MFDKLNQFVNTLFSKNHSGEKSIKMYVVVREDLPPIHRAVQASHAVAEFMLKHPTALNRTLARYDRYDTWNNGTIIILGALNENHLQMISNKVNQSRFVSEFIEPDWLGGNTLTAFATISYGDELADLPLLSMEQCPDWNRYKN